MKNFHQESHFQNLKSKAKRIKLAPNPQTPEMDPTLQSKVSSRNEIVLTRKQLVEAKWLFKQCDIKKPTWLRRRTKLNQRRRKALNDVLREAGLDQTLCGTAATKDWSGLLHTLWHQVNEVPLCK